MESLERIGAEVYAVLHKVSEEARMQIPSEILNMFEKFKDLAEEVELEDNILFEDQKISEEAKDIIFWLSLNYWLTEEEQKMVMAKLKSNENITIEPIKALDELLNAIDGSPVKTVTEIDLSRFTIAHQQNYKTALSEIKSGKKKSHWMCIFFHKFMDWGKVIRRKYML